MGSVGDREPRDFAFVQFVDAYDAAEARCHMNRQTFSGREISVVVAAETKKRLEDMPRRTRVRTISVSFSITFSFSSLPFWFSKSSSFKLTTLSPQVQGMQNTHDHQENPQKSDIVTAVAGHILQGDEVYYTCVWGLLVQQSFDPKATKYDNDYLLNCSLWIKCLMMARQNKCWRGSRFWGRGLK
ncbi:unnamed protein product [Camellia sinensis]